MKFSLTSPKMFTNAVGLGVLALGGVFAAESYGAEPRPQAAESAKPGAAHAEVGPHSGSLIELGKEEYHAELVHDEKAGTVTFYILDGAGKKAVPIDAAEVVVNLKHEGKPEQFKVAAKPIAGDPAGKSSCFFSADKELAEDLDHPSSQAQLVLTIAGKQYRGAVGSHSDGGAKHTR